MSNERDKNNLIFCAYHKARFFCHSERSPNLTGKYYEINIPCAKYPIWRVKSIKFNKIEIKVFIISSSKEMLTVMVNKYFDMALPNPNQ